ncbi:MAG: 16S rRNA (cytosine(967)-C(5))-methyltransferase RsmB [Oscillospiraceae bacterium]|nr:16S rRNA (cytosine(967)-C(5))-methyltransferase RsmB [Oscillospiraceae bacterium]
MDDRALAFKILNKIELDKAYSNLVLDAVLSTDKTEHAPFVSSLVYGVIERKITLDYILSGFLTQPIKKLKPQVLTILRMGTYQLKFMDKVPTFAAVNESVRLAKREKCAYAAGLINSVLRKIASCEIEYPCTDDKFSDLSIKYSCPVNLVKHFSDDYGIENAEMILKSSLGAPETVLRVNTLKTDADTLISQLEKDGFKAEKSPLIDNAVILKSGAVMQSSAYKNGLFHVQDTASQLCIQALDPKPDEIVFDMCSSPGGKAFTIAEKMENRGQIYAFDLYEHRVKLINDGAERLGIKIIKGSVWDSSIFSESLPIADRVLCDVPCSGLGVIRRKPEIRYKDLGFVDKLCDLQYNIINVSARYVKSGGDLVYSTCSLNKAENQNICDRFLSDNPSFKKVTLSDDDGYMTLMPHKNNTDGFFIAKFIKD